MAIPDSPMLRPGDLVPHFEVNTKDGRFNYSSIWQQSILVLVVRSGRDAEDPDPCDRQWTAAASQFRDRGAECVVTSDRVPGLPAAGVVVADRWGEIIYVAAVPPDERLPNPSELLDWVDHVQHQCPECQGEAR